MQKTLQVGRNEKDHMFENHEKTMQKDCLIENLDHETTELDQKVILVRLKNMGIVTLNNMKVIFLLKHTNYTNFDGKNIGYFSSYEKARSACLTVSHQLGFRDYPNDFEIICVPLYHQKDQLPKHAYELVKSTELDDVEKTYYLGIF